MKEITKIMIKEFEIERLNYDFMGYSLQKKDIYTFHHLIIPARFGGKCTYENGAILCGKTSHPYLHLIEAYNNEMFWDITNEMVVMNQLGKLDLQNLRRIHDILTQFERENCGKRTRKGKILIKEQYTRRARLWGKLM